MIRKSQHSLLLMILAVLVVACCAAGCGGGSGSAPPIAANVKSIPSSGDIHYDSTAFTIPAGTTTTVAVHLVGGTAGMAVSLTTSASGASDATAPTVTVSPNPLLAQTDSDHGYMNIDATNATAGSYVLAVGDSYTVNGQSQTQTLTPINVTVESSGTPVTPSASSSDTPSVPTAGYLSIIPALPSIVQGTSETILVSLNGSVGIDPFAATVMSDNAGVSVSPGTCQLASASSKCKLSITATSAASGIANLSLSAAGYTAKTASISVTPPVAGTIYYHIDLDNPVGFKTEAYVFDNAQIDLLMSQFIAGAMLGHLLHEKNAQFVLDRDYLYGTLIGQWLQENVQPDYKDPTQIWIDSDQSQRDTLLSLGQGGPYQLNDYSKRLESGWGMVNFVMMQKGLGYSVADQDSGVQTAGTGPHALEYKHFGPMAAAYFHYNDLLRIESLAGTTYWTPNKDALACMSNVASGKFPYFDMVLNAAYNAGPYSATFTEYVTLCANATNPSYSSQIAQIDNYSLTDAQYTAATNITGAGTYILYPRQIRLYLDQLYNNSTTLVQPAPDNHLIFAMDALRDVFATVFSNENVDFGSNAPAPLGHSLNGSTWQAITAVQAGAAFDQALTETGSAESSMYDIGKATDRSKVFDVLDAAIVNLQTSLGANFSATANTNLAIGESGSVTLTCPTNPTVFPQNRLSYTGGTIVKGTDGKLYQCLSSQVATWCQAGGAYTPTAGWSWQSAWRLYVCN